MENIKCELLTESNNELWEKYFELCQEISKRYYKSGYIPGKTAQKFREQIRKNTVNLSLHRDFVIFENEIPAAWFDLSIVENELYFGFDVLHNEVHEDILKTLFSKLYSELKDSSFSHAVNYTFREQMISAFNTRGAAINEEILISRLEKGNMDESFYIKIVENNELNKWQLKFYDEIPEELITDFIEFMGGIIVELGNLNPYAPKMYPFTAESWKKNLKNFGNKITACFLFDETGGIAGFSWVLSYPDFLIAVQHNGGLTAVAPKYRGMGIARYIKANLYLNLLKENKDFKYINTDTMPWNKYMYRINEEFGFKPYRKGCSFKLTKEFIYKYLNYHS